MNDLDTDKLPHLIALGGQAGVGKDTIARALWGVFQYRAVALAAPLYELVAARYNVTQMFLHVRGTKEQPSPVLGGQSPRRLLQRAGDELRRQEGDDVLIDRLRARIAAEPGTRFVVTDLRLAREADAIRDLGGVVVRLLPATEIGARYGCTGIARKHRTETDDFEADKILHIDAAPWIVATALLRSLQR